MAIRSAPLGAAPFTVADLEAIPDDGQFYELSNGALIVNPAPNIRHQAVAARLVVYLDAHRQPSQVVLVEAELYIRDDTVKRPDVMVVDRVLATGQRVMGTPDLVVEVASPSTSLFDRTEKRVVYAEAGIPTYWLVDPAAETVTVLELVDGAYVERTHTDVDLDAIFE